MRGTGTEQPVVVRKFAKADGAKGLRQSARNKGQPEKGGANGPSKAVQYFQEHPSDSMGDEEIQEVEKAQKPSGTLARTDCLSRPKAVCPLADVGNQADGWFFWTYKTDELGGTAIENRLQVKNLHATILHQLGLDSSRLNFFHNGLNESLVGVEGDSAELTTSGH